MTRACKCSHFEEDHAGGDRRLCAWCGGFQDATSEHTSDLLDLAETGLKIAARDLEKTSQIKMLFIFRLPA